MDVVATKVAKSDVAAVATATTASAETVNVSYGDNFSDISDGEFVEASQLLERSCLSLTSTKVTYNTS